MTTRRVHRLIALAVLTLALPLVAASSPAAAERPAAGPLYVVVFKDRVNPIIKILLLGVRPQFIYRYALSGFAAPLTPRQQAILAHDPSVLMVTPADRDTAPQTALPVSTGTTPVEQFPQILSGGLRRVGALASPTARIDGHDDPMNVDVAVLDTGIQSDHPDLNVAGGVSCSSSGDYEDDYGHGTLVAGLIGARDNAFGIVGVAPGARLWAVKVLDSDGVGTDANLLCGIDWVTQHARTIEVANMSLIDVGTDDGHCGLVNHDPVHWALCHGVAAGVTYIAGAGNDSLDASAFMPAGFPEVITASAMDDTDGLPGGLGPPDCFDEPDDSFAFFSNFGPSVDIAAPGVCVTSTFPVSDLAIDSGTSYAAPKVAGAAALLKIRHPWATPAQIKDMILAAREQVHLPGDPDGIDEGVLNVSTF